MKPIPATAWRRGEGVADHARVETPIIELIRASVMRAPDAPAIADAAGVLSYREMWNATMATAERIADATRPGDTVGIRLPAGMDYAVTILGCLAAGRVGVLLDAADPPARTREIMRKAGILTVFGDLGQPDPAARWLSPAPLSIEGPMRPARSPLAANAPAFVVATSGSTGAPKLIVHNQSSTVFMALGAAGLLGLGPGDRSAFTGAPSTRAALQHLVMPLVIGAMAIVCDLRAEGLNALLDLLARHRATTLRIFPSLARVLAPLPASRAALAELRSVRCIGEPLLASDLAMLRRILPPGAAVVNAYGATETVGFDWVAPPGPYRGGAVVSSGRMRGGAEFTLIGEDGAPCAPGFEGELLIRSRHNALGEWQDGAVRAGSMLSGEADGGSIYRTGDLAVIGADGDVTILGRKDRQFKVNGIRVEPAEIEEAMRAVPGIAAAAVVMRRTGQQARPVGFFVASAGAGDGLAGRVREALAARLPAVMQPARLVEVEALPMSAGFKLDTARLLAHEAATPP